MLADLVKEGKVIPFVDRQLTLWAEIADAVRHVESGHTRGKVAIAFA